MNLDEDARQDERQIARVVEVRPVYAGWRDNFTLQKKLMSGPIPSKDALGSAFVTWKLFPFYLNSLAAPDEDESIRDDNDFQSGIVALECLLTAQYEITVRFLMRVAESVGVDSTPIKVAGDYCRQILKSRWTTVYPIIDSLNEVAFPDCLGNLSGMPDIRNAIVIGNAAVEKVLILSGLKGQVDTMPLMGFSTSQSDEPKAERQAVTIRPDGPDPATRQLWIGGQFRTLEPKPFAMLCFMWGKSQAQERHVRDAVWPRDAASDQSFSSAQGKVNAALTEMNATKTLVKRGDFLLFE